LGTGLWVGSQFLVKNIDEIDHNVGKRIAYLAQALGMQVLIADRKNGNTLTSKDASTPRTPFAEVLKRSTVLILCLPRTPESLNLISTPEFKLMSKHAVLINVARGGIVDESALVKALKDGQLSGAATDVFEIEPAEGAKDSPLLGDEARGLNLTLTPHVAWFGERTKKNLQRILKANVELWAAGTPQNVIV
jgi:phosphoglycerate dehydrogenase-like enzyme